MSVIYKRRNKGWLLERSYLKAEPLGKKQNKTKKTHQLESTPKQSAKFYSNLANCWDQNGAQNRGQNKSRWNWTKVRKNEQYKQIFPPLGSHLRFQGFWITPTSCDRFKQTHGRKSNFYDSKFIANTHDQRAWSGPTDCTSSPHVKFISYSEMIYLSVGLIGMSNVT